MIRRTHWIADELIDEIKAAAESRKRHSARTGTVAHLEACLDCDELLDRRMPSRFR
jgi:hypothetical protein